MSEVCPNCGSLTTKKALNAYKSCAKCYHKKEKVKTFYQFECNKCISLLKTDNQKYNTKCQCGGTFEFVKALS